jgi:hypothetical protein
MRTVSTLGACLREVSCVPAKQWLGGTRLPPWPFARRAVGRGPRQPQHGCRCYFDRHGWRLHHGRLLRPRRPCTALQGWRLLNPPRGGQRSRRGATIWHVVLTEARAAGRRRLHLQPKRRRPKLIRSVVMYALWLATPYLRCHLVADRRLAYL